MFSVLVSIYKVESYLRECIESILNQTYSNFEIILVDDGSPDNCPRICDEYAQKYNKVKVVHKQNGGLVSARKAGLELAEGDYICFVDGDDFIQNDMLKTYHDSLSEQQADVICCGVSNYWNGTIARVAQKVPAGFYSKNRLKKDIYPYMLSNPPFFSFYVIPSVCAKCFKKEIAIEVYKDVPQDISLGEDVAVSYPALLCAESISVIDYFGYMYRQNSNSMTHTYNKDLYRNIKNLIAHFKSQKEKYEWCDTRQMDEYIVYLLYLAKTNEMIYNTQQSYRIKRHNFNRYLNDEDFQQSVSRVRVDNLKDKVIVWCLKNKIVLPLYLLSKKS